MKSTTIAIDNQRANGFDELYAIGEHISRLFSQKHMHISQWETQGERL